MSSRVPLALLAVLVFAGDAVAQDFGGRRLEFAVNSGWTDFDSEIRFDDAMSVSATVLADVLPFFSMGLELGHIGAKDREQDIIQDVLVASIRGRIEPWRDARFSGGGVLGVTFVAFENRPDLDSISEGFELGGSARWNIDADWRLRMDLLLRLQTVNRPVLDDAGLPTEGEDETGFVWSQVYRVGIGRGF